MLYNPKQSTNSDICRNSFAEDDMDRRAARAEHSRSKFKAAFLELFQAKEPSEITVIELCQKAGLNRSTFYAHFGYMERFIRELLWEEVENVLKGYGPQWDLPLEDGGVDRNSIATYIRRLLSNTTVMRFCTCEESGNYRNLVIRAHVELTLGTSDDMTRYYTAYIHNAGVLSFLFEWFNSGLPMPEETAVEIIHEFSKVMYSKIA